MPVLLVITPGVALDAYQPLLAALGEAGHGVMVVDAPCANQGSEQLVEQIRRAAEGSPADVVLVAHGLGATLALKADPEVSRYVLLAPVLGHLPVVDSLALASLEVGGPVDLRAVEGRWAELQDRLVGPLELGCAPAGFAREVQGWLSGAPIGLDLASIEQPVWMAVSLGDDVAGVEVVVPASRDLPDRTLVRLGVNRLDPRDYGHADLLRDPVPIRAAVAAVGR